MADQHRMPTHHPRIIGTRHMVASANYLAAQTGFAILEAGGNAIDAGVAGGIALGVLQCEYVHFAGVAPIMIHIAETGETVSISGLGPWPKLASAAWFREHQGGRILSNIKRSRGAGRAGCVDHRAGTLRHDEFCRGRRRGDPLRARGLRPAVDLARDHVRERRDDPPLAAERRDLSARRRGADAGAAVLPDRSRELDPVHGG